MSIIPRNQTLQCASYCRVRLHCVHPSAESSSAVCIPLRSQAPRCASHCRVRKIIYIKNSAPRWEHNYHERKDLKNFFLFAQLKRRNEFKNMNTDIFKEVWLRSEMHTLESDSTVCIIPQSQASQCASHCRVLWPNFLKNSKVWCTPQSQAPWCAMCILLRRQAPGCASHRKLSSVVCVTPWSGALQ